MAVTIKGSQVYQSGSGGYSASHTLPDLDASGVNTLAVAAGFNRNPASDVTSWTFEGSTPTAIADSINASVVAVSTQRYLINNSATTIVSNTPSYKLQAMIGVALEGVDQTTPITGTPATAGGYGTAATAAYTGTSGNMLLVFVSSQSDRTFTASGVTDITSVTHADANLGAGYGGYVTASGSSQTIGAALSSADNWRLVIFEVEAAASGTTVTPGVASLVLTAFAPTVVATDNKSVTPGAAALTLSAFTPTVAVSDNKSVTPGVATLTLTPYAPTATVTDNKFATPGLATLALTPFAPSVSVSDNKFATPGAATLTLTAYAPTAAVSDHKTAVPGAASLALTAYPPTVSVSGSSAVTGSFFYSL